MRAIIIDEKDIQALLTELEFEKMKGATGRRWGDPNVPPSAQDMHRAFHYLVVRWFQEQGASCVRHHS